MKCHFFKFPGKIVQPVRSVVCDALGNIRDAPGVLAPSLYQKAENTKVYSHFSIFNGVFLLYFGIFVPFYFLITLFENGNIFSVSVPIFYFEGI